MSAVAVARTQTPNPAAAGTALGEEIKRQLGGISPQAVILFASPAHSTPQLLRALTDACQPKHLVGCSTAGELTHAGPSQDSVVALALDSNTLRFRTASGHAVSTDVEGAVERLARAFPEHADDLPHRTVLLLSDALAGFAEVALKLFTAKTHGRFQVVGGGAGDGARFGRTKLFLGTEVLEDALVALEIQSLRPVGVGVAHGWTPNSPVMRATQTRARSIVTLDGEPAFDVLAAFARERGETLDRAAPMPYFLHNVLGIETREGYKLRVPLAVEADGSVTCAAEVPQGALVRMMRSSVASAEQAAVIAAQRARGPLHGQATAVLFFDCAATRFRMGLDFALSVSAIQREFESSACAGFNTYGQFARVDGQFSGFHNCTAVVCAIPL